MAMLPIAPCSSFFLRLSTCSSSSCTTFCRSLSVSSGFFPTSCGTALSLLADILTPKQLYCGNCSTFNNVRAMFVESKEKLERLVEVNEVTSFDCLGGARGGDGPGSGGHIFHLRAQEHIERSRVNEVSSFDCRCGARGGHIFHPQMGLLFRNKNVIQCSICANGPRSSSCFDAFQGSDDLQISPPGSTEGDLRLFLSTTVELLILSLFRAFEVKWDYYFGTEGVFPNSLIKSFINFSSVPATIPSST